jgi:AbrB family looped-hinge helix DNA binding protein
VRTDGVVIRARVTSKGQVTIPKPVRERLGLRTGDEIEFVEERGKLQVRKHIDEGVFDKYLGFLRHLEGADPDELVEEMRGR